MVNFDNKKFRLLDNSSEGKVDSETIFYYKQKNELVTADYFGGSIIFGKIIAQHIGDTLHMLYNCYTTSKELKAGKAQAHISKSKEDKILLTLNWQWLENAKTGTSTYIEI